MKGIYNLKRWIMHFRKSSAELSVMEAVDNLSALAELDQSLSISQEKQQALTEEQVAEKMQTLSWHDPEYFAYNRERVKETFRALLKYLKDLHEKDLGQLREIQTQQGIQAMMLLASEAVQKIDHFTEIFKTEVESVAELKEFKELQHFYLTKVVQRFQNLLEIPEKWQEEWGSGTEEEKDQGITRMEGVRRDQEYELFFLQREDGRPYFNRSVLRHMELLDRLDGMLRDPKKEDLFLRIAMIHDRDTHLTAKEILHVGSVYIDEFFKEAMKFKQIGFVRALTKAVMALMLAANARNLMQNTTLKSTHKYFEDFHFYLRSALLSAEYQRFLTHPPALSERFLHSVMNLCHLLCSAFFLRSGLKSDMIAFIRMLIEKGSGGTTVEKETKGPTAFWNTLLDEDYNIRTFLKRYPNGPLLKTLAVFKEEKEMRGFDPLALQNFPRQLYTVIGNEHHITCLRLPSPTRQKEIEKADIADEFYGFLRALGSQKRNQRHLLINLQDRTSWLEHARCTALEKIEKKTEFSNAFTTITLPRDTDFYLQAGDYLELNDAKAFISALKEQIKGGELCGFHFPVEASFINWAAEAVHTLFFASKEVLSHKNRLDFIEILYLLLILKAIDHVKPDTISFTCKDGVDTGAALSAELYAFLKVMNSSSHWSKEEKEFFQWMLYEPALSVRERAIDERRLARMVSALSLISGELEAHPREITTALSKLYRSSFFSNVKVQEIE